MSQIVAILAQERVDQLTKLVLELFPSFGYAIEIIGGARSGNPADPYDFGEYSFHKGSEQIGHYKYDLVKGSYVCQLNTIRDDRIENILRERFPELRVSDDA